MKLAITGATGFLGRYILRKLLSQGYSCRCWKRPQSDLSGLQDLHTHIEWVEGNLAQPEGFADFVKGTEAVIHAALARPAGSNFRTGGERDLLEFLQMNLMGSLSLMKVAREARVERFIFISTCAVHEEILKDRLLDETHPLWPYSHYGAYKAAVEKFVHSYGLGEEWKVCSLRPTGIYGLAHPPGKSKWADLITRVRRGEKLKLSRGGKEVHAGDVAEAVTLLLKQDGISGQCYNCYDRYISEGEVARIAKKELQSNCEIEDSNTGPKNQIDTKKIRALGMKFGGKELLEETVREIIHALPG